jgi:hypothetical protein
MQRDSEGQLTVRNFVEKLQSATLTP